MSDIHRIASVGMQGGQQRLQAIALNAASASLNGYRRHVAIAQPFEASFSPAAATADPRSADLRGASAVADIVGQVVHQVDLRPGAIAVTSRALDLAIEGDDLFFALTDGSQTWLTRAGSFSLNRDGVLVGERGLRVVGTQGDVRLPGNDVEVRADGQITNLGEVVATLQLFAANDRTSLQASQGTLLASASGIRPAEPGAGRIRSGSLEASNSDSGREMVSLVALTRQFEGLIRVVQGYDELLGRVIQKLGEV